jgi:hypothetical protein
MTLSSYGHSSVPDGPPLACIARHGAVLHVTVLHGNAADFFWGLREPLTAAYGCSSLRLSVLEAQDEQGTRVELEWDRPSGRDPSFKSRRS